MPPHKPQNFDKKFLIYYTKRYPEKAGLRAPNLDETMEADKLLLEEVCHLVNDQEWSLDGALHEMTAVRSDMATLMAARPKAPKPPANNYHPYLGKGQGHQKGRATAKGSGKPAAKGSNRGGSLGGNRGGQPRQRPRLSDQWDPAWAKTIKVNGHDTDVCMRYHLTSCHSPSCGYAHRCPIKKSNGQICGASHTVQEHWER